HCGAEWWIEFPAGWGLADRSGSGQDIEPNRQGVKAPRFFHFNAKTTNTMPQVDIRQIDDTFRGEEDSRMFIDPVCMDDDLRQPFRVIPDVVSKKKLAFAQELEKIVRSYSGCGFAPINGFRAYERWVEVDRAKADVAMCWEEFRDT